MKKFEKLFLTSFLFLLSFVPFLWLSKGQLILGYDAVFPLNPTAFLLDRIYSWTSVQGFTMDQSGIQGSLIIHFIDSIPYFLGFSAEYAQKIVFSFWFFAILFSAYIFIVRIEKAGFINSKYLRYFFPVFYTFNFYLLQGWWAIERTKFSLVVALPLILSVILPMVKEKMSIEKVLRNSVLCSLILTVFNGGGWVGLPLYGGLFVMLGCYYLFFAFIFLLSRKIKEFLLMGLFFVFFALWHIFLNAYTLLPFVLTTIKSYGEIVASAGGITGLIEWSRYINASASFINLFRLQGIPDWYNNGRFHPYAATYLNDPLFIFLSFLIPLAIFLSLFKKRENKLIIPFFLLALIISQFFTAGAHPPLGFIFEFLMKAIPGFVGFRSAIFKFGYAYWFCVSFFVALFLSNLLVFLTRKMKDGGLSSLIAIISPVVIILLILFYHFPYITGNVFRIDPTSTSARVKLPTYVSDFAKWWQENGKTDKILLLPKLNDNWFFEQYKWNYLSLFPITGNFASRNIIENAVILSENEQIIVGDLYDAINAGNYEKIDYLLSVLGIRYFLVRHDFYYDYPHQKTDNPDLVEEKLIANTKVSRVASFGEWIVYKYSDPKPLFTAHNNNILISGKVATEEFYSLNRNNTLIFTQDIFQKYPETFSSIFISPSCLNCSIEKEEIQVTFPKPRILIDSNLYQLVELRDKLKISKTETIEQKTNRLIGNTLRLVGQIDQLIDQDRDEYYIGVAKDKLVKVLREISSEMPNIFNKSNNPYYYVIRLQQYLDQEDKHLNDLIASKVDREGILVILEEVLHSIQNLRDRLKQYYDDSDYNKQKIYKFSVAKDGVYNVRINKSSFGILDNPDLKSISLNIDNQASRSGVMEESNVNFGSVFLKKGNHGVVLNVPSQESIFSRFKYERLAGKNCYSSFADNFSYKKVYSLKFKSRNNFDPGFFFFVDHGSGFSPISINYIPVAGEQIKNERIVISSSRMQLDKTMDKLRVSFCALSLTEELYRGNINSLSFVELTSPEITLSYKISDKSIVVPQINFRELNQTHFKVSVKNAKAPYYLVFSQKYAVGWEASVGEHLIGNKFQNVWYVDKTGNYEIDILYKPQDYLNIGFVISIFSLLAAFFVIWRTRKNV